MCDARLCMSVFLMALWTVPLVFADDQTLYRWTDAYGRTHFSDRPPAGESAPRVERLTAPSYADSGVPTDHYSVSNQLQRMQQGRLLRERERQQRQREARERVLRELQIDAAERAAARDTDRDSDGGSYLLPYASYYRPGYGRPHRRQPHRPANPPSLWQPDHPAYRPYPRRPPVRPRPSMRVDGG